MSGGASASDTGCSGRRRRSSALEQTRRPCAAVPGQQLAKKASVWRKRRNPGVEGRPARSVAFSSASASKTPAHRGGRPPLRDLLRRRTRLLWAPNRPSSCCNPAQGSLRRDHGDSARRARTSAKARPVYLSAVSDAKNAHEDSLQARNALLPQVQSSLQYLGHRVMGENLRRKVCHHDGIPSIARGEFSIRTFSGNFMARG